MLEKTINYRNIHTLMCSLVVLLSVTTGQSAGPLDPPAADSSDKKVALEV
jgi:hypothetical protein